MKGIINPNKVNPEDLIYDYEQLQNEKDLISLQMSQLKIENEDLKRLA